MANRIQVSVEEYLRTSYRPDCDYVDGEVIERNLGEFAHSSLQRELVIVLAAHYPQLRKTPPSGAAGAGDGESLPGSRCLRSR